MLIKGFLLGLGLLTSFGPQNLFLMKQGFLRDQHYKAAAVCLGADLVLVLCGVMFGGLVSTINPTVSEIATVASGILIILVGLFGVILGINRGHIQHENHVSSKSVVKEALFVSLVNPLAIVANLVIIGGAAQYFTTVHKVYYIIGLIAAGTVWFFGVVYLLSSLNVARPIQFLRYLEIGSGLVMIGLGMNLLRMTL